MLKDISLKEAQGYTFELLKIFDKICRDNNLVYMLSGGTLLGAIRHKGFIPWDDDIDVMMPRADYDRLLRLKLELSESIELCECSLQEDYFYPFAKLCNMTTKLYFPHHIEEKSIGIFLDIFPIEGLPDSSLKRNVYFKRMKTLNALRNSAVRKEFLENEKFKGVKKAVVMPVAKKVGANEWALRMNRAAKKYSFDGRNYRAVTMITHYGSRECMPAEVFDSVVEVDFESIITYAPVGYDTYLTNLYGDYMQLPPEDKRVTDHSNFIIEVRDE